MSKFLDYFEGRQTGWKDDRPVYTTLAPLRYCSGVLGTTIIVPAEFITDLSSVPRLPLAWLVAGGRGTRSAVCHDWSYQFGWWLLLDGQKLIATRQLADAVFYESLRADPISGASRITAWLMYTALRAGGWLVWNRRMERTPDLNPEWSESEGVVPPQSEPVEPIVATAPEAPPVVSVPDTKEIP